MDVLDKILQLRLERNGSEYRLSEESGIAQTTISSWFRKKVCPSIPSLEKICNAYHITLSQFFSESGEASPLTNEQQALVHEINHLTDEQRETLLCFLKTL